MAVVIILLLLLSSSLVILVSHWVHNIWRKRNLNTIGHDKLPPGSMGYPFIGETLEFFVAHGFDEIHPFITKRMSRYGPLFKTNLVGIPLIVSTDSEFNHYIFQQEGKLFQIEYTQSFVELFGKDISLMNYHGNIHKYLKNLILNFVSRQRLKDQLLHEIDGAIRRTLASWTHRQDVNLTEAVPDMLFEYFAFKLISYDESKEKKKLRSNFKHFIDGLISFPLNIPGTSYHASWKGRKDAMKMIEETCQERKASKVQRNDFLDVVIEETEKENACLNEASAINLLFILLFAGHETTSQALILLIKFITENPSVLAKLTVEHESILKSRGNSNKDDAVTWEEYKSMSFTHMVINETLRIANIAPMMFRRVIQDIEIKGYKIPAGWLVMMIPGAAHFNPGNYEDPFKFNPRRWEGQELHAASKNFMPFGGGLRNCIGSDLAKVQMAIFIHHFVTNYRWKIIRGGKIIRRPTLQFPDGLHMKVRKASDDRPMTSR